MNVKTIADSTGVVVEVDVSGVGLLEDHFTHHRYPFTFDKVKGYFGQDLAKAGLVRGAEVKFDIDDGYIKLVEVLPVR